MAKPRASIFEETAEIDVTGFAPKRGPDATAPAPEQVRAVAEAANFRSREARPPKAASSTREPRRYRTGRNVQFNLKASQETVDAFYAITDKHGWVRKSPLLTFVACRYQASDEWDDDHSHCVRRNCGKEWINLLPRGEARQPRWSRPMHLLVVSPDTH